MERQASKVNMNNNLLLSSKSFPYFSMNCKQHLDNLHFYGHFFLRENAISPSLLFGSHEAFDSLDVYHAQLVVIDGLYFICCCGIFFDTSALLQNEKANVK